jgi:sterol desaturase/sphingolipid hydroxylase (fatty acid hydroxylase superfamily)
MTPFNEPKQVGGKILFTNPILEKLTHWPIGVPIILFIAYAGLLLTIHVVYSAVSIPLSILLFFFGWIFFSWTEYQVHRYLFHLSAMTLARKKFQYLLHGVHHAHPNDTDRLAMPPVLSIAIATLFLFALRFLMGNFVFAFLPGFLLGYAFYLFIHYLIHVHQLPKNIFKHLWINHAIHHHRDDKVLFGVSSPVWDYVYGTLPKNQLKL